MVFWRCDGTVVKSARSDTPPRRSRGLVLLPLPSNLAHGPSTFVHHLCVTDLREASRYCTYEAGTKKSRGSELLGLPTPRVWRQSCSPPSKPQPAGAARFDGTGVLFSQWFICSVSSTSQTPGPTLCRLFPFSCPRSVVESPRFDVRRSGVHPRGDAAYIPEPVASGSPVSYQVSGVAESGAPFIIEGDVTLRVKVYLSTYVQAPWSLSPAKFMRIYIVSVKSEDAS